jgi:hypothetical protein
VRNFRPTGSSSKKQPSPRISIRSSPRTDQQRPAMVAQGRPRR